MPSERDNFSWEIVEHIGVIRAGSNGWSMELNVVSWNGGQPKFDVRAWDQDHEHMTRGVSLFEGEFRKMIDLFYKHNSRKVVEKARAERAEREERSRQASPYPGNRSGYRSRTEENVPAATPPDPDPEWDTADRPGPAEGEDDMNEEALLKGVAETEAAASGYPELPAGMPEPEYTRTADETPF